MVSANDGRVRVSAMSLAIHEVTNVTLVDRAASKNRRS
jgi:hypothetical protein